MSRNLEHNLRKLRSTIIHTLFYMFDKTLFTFNLKLRYWWKFSFVTINSQIFGTRWDKGLNSIPSQMHIVANKIPSISHTSDFYLMWEYHSYFRSNISLSHKYSYSKRFFEFSRKKWIVLYATIKNFSYFYTYLYIIIQIFTCFYKA